MAFDTPLVLELVRIDDAVFAQRQQYWPPHRQGVYQFDATSGGEQRRKQR